MRLPLPWALSLSARLLVAATTWTYAAPDEYWQGPEVAHRMVWGSGAT